MFDSEKKKYLLVIFILLGLITLAIVVGYFILSRRAAKPVEETAKVEPAVTSDSIVPTNSKSPEDFLGKVQEKSEAIQKNYDTNLAEFAQKRWERFFREQNSGNKDFELKILSPQIQKTADGSTLFKVKYRVKQGDLENEMEDYYYLILSDVKKVELGASNLKANVFLTEEDIRKNLGQTNFAKIGKVK